MALPNCLRSWNIWQRVFPRAPRQAQHLRADANAPFVQRLDGNLVALAHFAQHVFLRHLAVFQDQFACARCPNAQLVFLLAHRETGKVFFDHECRDALVSRRRIDVREEDEHAGFLGVGDPQLAAVQDVVIALQFGPRLQRKRVRAGTGLAERIRAHRVGGHAAAGSASSARRWSSAAARC